MKIEELLAWIGGGLFMGYFFTKAKNMSSITPSVFTGGPQPQNRGVAFAVGAPSPVFPVGPSNNSRRGEVGYLDVNGKTHGNGSRKFMATRKNNRYHAGIDLYAEAGDAVLAPESGRIVSTQNFLGSIPGDDAMVFAGDSGVVFLLGEIKEDSWKEFGLDIGSAVAQGQALARVGLTVNGSHMLHFETYTAGTKRSAKWYRDSAPPGNLLDPTLYLLRSSGR